MPYYVFAIGGTGARCLESLVYLCAMGLGPKELHPIIVDPDSSNGNLNRTKELIINYKKIRDKINNPVKGSLFYTNIIFKEEEKVSDTPVEVPNYFNPNSGLEGGNNKLSHFIEYHNTLKNTNEGFLAELLFSQDEFEMEMKQGYRGVPSIGSILMTNIQKHKIWDVLISRLQNDPNSRVFMFASVFGGTGASGYPVISKLIKNEAINTKVGGALILPYFRLPDPNNVKQLQKKFREEKVLPNSNSFMLNSKAACEHYKNDFDGVDSNYVLGDDLDRCKQYDDYQIGNEEQKNDAHMIELFAAYAAMDFWEKKDNNFKRFYHIQVKNPNGDNNDNIEACDLPQLNNERSENLFERFSLLYHYLKDFKELVDKNNVRKLNQIAWLRKSKYKGKDIPGRKEELEILYSFYILFKMWIEQNHRNSASLSVLDESLDLDRLVKSNQDKFKNKPINRLDIHLFKNHKSGGSLTETFIKSASEHILSL